ncbi:hypothetical protein BAE44_0013127 [Dichanthelium oligosanthes]|uniref:RING-type domain-containing protein n=1 Tax=Dichanthelium oligosanthes TaxID=888268 RepID=A0A1E5VLC2_9POAL|nr:hypothetical protein BAE44_0013127 [Dichanthelium oligosanthes]
MLSDSRTAVDASSAPLLVTPASAAAATVGGSLRPPAGGGSDATFDADMVIILAAMLCILVCAIVLNSLIRCFRQHSGLTHTLAAPRAAATMAAAPAATDSGLKKRELMRIPVVVYEVKAGVSASECAICLGEFDDGEKLGLDTVNRVLTNEDNCSLFLETGINEAQPWAQNAFSPGQIEQPRQLHRGIFSEQGFNPDQMKGPWDPGIPTDTGSVSSDVFLGTLYRYKIWHPEYPSTDEFQRRGHAFAWGSEIQKNRDIVVFLGKVRSR